jgi:tetratricopeptide (TPR) repeat protein
MRKNLIIAVLLVFFCSGFTPATDSSKSSYKPLTAEEDILISKKKKRRRRRVKKKRRRRKKSRRRKKRSRVRVAPKPQDKDKMALSYVLNAYLDEDYEETIDHASKLLKNPRLRRAAHYYVALSLANMEYYRSALYYFGKIVKMGVGRSPYEKRYYQQAVNSLVKIAHEIPDDTVIPHLLKGVPIKKIGIRKKKKFYYFLGKYHYITGQYNATIRNLKMVDKSSKYYSRAKYVMGVVYALKKNYRKALGVFRKITRLPERQGEVDNRLVIDKANVAIARLFYGFGKYRLSQAFYEKISDESPLWMTAVFESSWAYFVNKDYNKVLGKLEVINSPFFDDKFVPEFALLRGIVMLRMCRIVELKPSIISFNKSYTPLIKPMSKYLKKYRNDKLRHYKAIENYFLDKDYFMGIPTRVVSHIAMEDATYSMFYKVFSIQDERQALLDDTKGSKSHVFFGKVAKRLGGYVIELKKKAAFRIGNRLKYLYKNLGDQIDRSRLVRLQFMGEEKVMMEKNMVVYKKDEKKKSRLHQKSVKVPDDHIYWPFETEYWRDELGYYEFRMENACEK